MLGGRGRACRHTRGDKRHTAPKHTRRRNKVRQTWCSKRPAPLGVQALPALTAPHRINQPGFRFPLILLRDIVALPLSWSTEIGSASSRIRVLSDSLIGVLSYGVFVPAKTSGPQEPLGTAVVRPRRARTMCEVDSLRAFCSAMVGLGEGSVEEARGSSIEEEDGSGIEAGGWRW